MMEDKKDSDNLITTWCSDKIKLNVGGVMYQTSKSNLCGSGPNFFTSM